MRFPATAPARVGVLVSGGLDSTVLLADELSQGRAIHPIHVRCGFSWEPAEARVIARLLSEPPFAGQAPPAVALTVDARHLYPADHWARRGAPPAWDSPDSDVCLDARNVVLITHAADWCRRHGVHRLVLGSLAGNPFPDATAGFFATMTAELSRGRSQAFDVAAPYLTLTKRDVARRGRALGVTLDLTLSCMNPGEDDRHCMACSKCRERADALKEFAGSKDPAS
jgi:7-cyano-7-deazaguanine synthase